MLLTSSDTKQTQRNPFLFTNSAQRELVSICTQSIRNCNKLSLHYILEISYIVLVSITLYTVQELNCCAADFKRCMANLASSITHAAAEMALGNTETETQERVETQYLYILFLLSDFLNSKSRKLDIRYT